MTTPTEPLSVFMVARIRNEAITEGDLETVEDCDKVLGKDGTGPGDHEAAEACAAIATEDHDAAGDVFEVTTEGMDWAAVAAWPSGKQ